MSTDDKNLDNVVPFNGDHGAIALHAARQRVLAVATKALRLEAAEVELRQKLKAALLKEQAFEQAHAKLEQRVEERTKALTADNVRLRDKVRQNARLEAAVGKVMASLDLRVEERALELLRANYGVGGTVIDGPGR